MSFALVFLRLTRNEFYSLTMREWGEMLKVWKIKKDNEIHEKAIVTINLMASSGNLRKETDFGKLYEHLVKSLKGETDENGDKKPMNKEELEEFKKIFGLM